MQLHDSSDMPTNSQDRLKTSAIVSSNSTVFPKGNELHLH